MTDNSFFAAVNDEIVQVDLWSGELIRRLIFQHIKPPNSNFCINAIKAGCLGTDNVIVAVNEAGEVIINFISSVQPALVLDNHLSTWGIAIEPRKRQVAVSSNEWLIRIYDLVSGKTLIFRGHEHNIPGVDFSSDGDFLVSCSIDGSCRIWNVNTGDLIASDIISDQWHWTAQFIRIQDVHTITDISKFFQSGAKCSLEKEINSDHDELDSNESWHSAIESVESLNYYDCMEDTHFLSKELILSTNVTSIFLSELNGHNVSLQAHIENLSDMRDHRYRDLNRLCIVKWIKELSSAIVVSQVGLVGLLRIVKYEDSQKTTKYGMKIEKWLNLPLSPILGVASISVFNQQDPCLNHVLLTVVNYDLKLYLYRLSFSSLSFSLDTCDF